MTEILKRYKEAGARGFGEHKVGLPFDHPQMMQLYEACDTLELPILFHLDDLRGIDTPGLPRLENVLKAFPKLPLIGHACGFWSSISGDATQEDFGRYPTPPKPITPGGALDRLMDAYANLYCDISEPGGTIALTRDPAFAREFVLRRADRLLFGSDYLAPGQQIPQFEILSAMNLPDEVAVQNPSRQRDSDPEAGRRLSRLDSRMCGGADRCLDSPHPVAHPSLHGRGILPLSGAGRFGYKSRRYFQPDVVSDTDSPRE